MVCPSPLLSLLFYPINRVPFNLSQRIKQIPEGSPSCEELAVWTVYRQYVNNVGAKLLAWCAA